MHLTLVSSFFTLVTIISRGIGLFLDKDMQTPLPFHPPSEKRAVSIYWSKLLRNVLKRMKNQFFNLCDFYFLTSNRIRMGKIVSIRLQKNEKNAHVLKRVFEFMIIFLCDS